MTKILCVEDNEDNLLMLQRRLSRRGCEVTISTHGAESLEWAKTLLPDLMVMHLNLPGLDGWEATRRLKNRPETKDIPIIVLTADTTKKSHEKAVAAGCDGFALKPIDFNGHRVTRQQARETVTGLKQEKGSRPYKPHHPSHLAT